MEKSILKKTFFLSRHSPIFLLLVLFGCQQQSDIEIREDFKEYYSQFQVNGSFVLYNQNEDKYLIYNPEGAKKPYTPASTYKIFNSLIGLETGVIEDENFVIPWDSVVRPNPNWNMDQDLQTAIKNSTVWYYQELARRVGAEKMKSWLDKANYGNADISGGIDQFWLSGDLRISPEQQIDFLRKLHDNKLPFSERSMSLVRNIMIRKDTLNYIERGKTGWGVEEDKDIGWYVGYIETKDNVYYFANCIEATNIDSRTFDQARTKIVYHIFDQLGLSPENENL